MMDMKPDTNIRLQNLRDFTVQIRNAKDEIVGTGIAVSMDGKIVTCAHVAEAALGVHPRKVSGAEIGVYFPQARGGEEKKRNATVSKFFPNHDDDVVLLQVTGGTTPLAPEQIVVLGKAEASQGNLFRSYGFRPLPPYVGGWGDGTIMGCVDCPEDINLQAEPVQLDCKHIAPGMSGSGVLDTERNLVIGIISETWIPDATTKDRDTGWAVNARVLSIPPLDLNVRDAPLDLKAAPEPKIDIAVAQAAVSVTEKYCWNNAPAVLPEWTGRDELLKQPTADWNDPYKHVTGLIGFGGEGKSSLARKWVDALIGSKVETLEGSNVQTFQPSNLPTGIFWWGFYENRSVDEFLEAALKYLSGGRIDPRQVPSSSTRAQIIGAMLGAGRYLFVLDGLEVMQHQEGDQYGLLTSTDLRDLLTYFARLDNQSFCLITSRAPLLDLMEYTTYTHRDVDRLLEADGIALLEKLGVKGSKEQMRKVVADWDGHALTISLLGSYLAEKHGGDIAHLADIPVPTAGEPRYQRVHRVLRRYDEHLTDGEREFLKLFSAFRTPVHEDAFEKVFVPLLPSLTAETAKSAEKKKKISAVSALSAVKSLVARLVTYRILRHDTASQTYTAHPLVRNHYLAILTHDTGAPDTHLKIKDYYLSIAGDTPQYPTLEDLKPLIEVVHHMCSAGAYDEAFNQVYWERIAQRDRFVIVHQLGAYETDLALIIEFFQNGDLSQEPQVTDKGDKRWIINAVGFRLMSLGRLREAAPFFERYVKGNIEAQDWHNASIVYRNLADLYASLGALEQSAESAHQALDLARKAENKEDEYNSLCWQTWIAHLQGNIEQAKDNFPKAEKLKQEIEPDTSYMYSLPGIWHADHLRRTGQVDYARRVTEANLKLMVDNHWPDDTSRCHRVLGDLDSDAGNHDSARAHYETALKIARSISRRDVLIEALLARGRWQAKLLVGAGSSRPRSRSPHPGSGDLVPTVADAFNDLNEALTCAVEGGYRIYEADIRVALAWAWLTSIQSPVNSDQSSVVSGRQSAKAEATRALQMSKEMGYYWGKIDAEEVLGVIAKGGG